MAITTDTFLSYVFRHFKITDGHTGIIRIVWLGLVVIMTTRWSFKVDIKRDYRVFYQGVGGLSGSTSRSLKLSDGLGTIPISLSFAPTLIHKSCN